MVNRSFTAGTASAFISSACIFATISGGGLSHMKMPIQNVGLKTRMTETPEVVGRSRHRLRRGAGLRLQGPSAARP